MLWTTLSVSSWRTVDEIDDLRLVVPEHVKRTVQSPRFMNFRYRKEVRLDEKYEVETSLEAIQEFDFHFGSFEELTEFLGAFVRECLPSPRLNCNFDNSDVKISLNHLSDEQREKLTECYNERFDKTWRECFISLSDDQRTLYILHSDLAASDEWKHFVEAVASM